MDIGVRSLSFMLNFFPYIVLMFFGIIRIVLKFKSTLVRFFSSDWGVIFSYCDVSFKVVVSYWLSCLFFKQEWNSISLSWKALLSLFQGIFFTSRVRVDKFESEEGYKVSTFFSFMISVWKGLMRKLRDLDKLLSFEGVLSIKMFSYCFSNGVLLFIALYLSTSIWPIVHKSSTCKFIYVSSRLSLEKKGIELSSLILLGIQRFLTTLSAFSRSPSCDWFLDW